MTERERKKREYRAYREVAVRQAADIHPQIVRVDAHLAAVHANEEGAFVEATLWVPRVAIPREEPE